MNFRVYAGLKSAKWLGQWFQTNAPTMSSDDARSPIEMASEPSGAALGASQLLSQRGFLDIVHQEIDWVARSGESSLLLMLQPDHQERAVTRDLEVQQIGQALCAALRPQDHVGLIDHEVFGVVLHDCQAEHALQVIQSLQGLVHRLATPQRPLTASIGAAFAPLYVRSEVSVWMARVLAQLLTAQSRGGNCICVDSRYLSALSTHDVEQYLSASTIEFRSPKDLH